MQSDDNSANTICLSLTKVQHYLPIGFLLRSPLSEFTGSWCSQHKTTNVLDRNTEVSEIGQNFRFGLIYLIKMTICRDRLSLLLLFYDYVTEKGAKFQGPVPGKVLYRNTYVLQVLQIHRVKSVCVGRIQQLYKAHVRMQQKSEKSVKGTKNSVLYLMCETPCIRRDTQFFSSPDRLSLAHPAPCSSSAYVPFKVILPRSFPISSLF